MPEPDPSPEAVIARWRGVLTEAALADRSSGPSPWKKRLPQILQTLQALGRTRLDEDAGWRAE